MKDLTAAQAEMAAWREMCRRELVEPDEARRQSLRDALDLLTSERRRAEAAQVAGALELGSARHES